MKLKQITILVAWLLIISSSLAQAQYDISEQKVQFDKATVSAWMISVGEEPLKDLQKGFAHYAKDQLDVKPKKRGRDMMVAKEVSIPSIASHQGDLKTKFFTEGNQTKMAIAFQTGYDMALNTRENADEMNNLRRFTRNFVKSYKTEQLNEQIADDQKRKKTIESNYEKNEREHKKLTKHISKLERKISSDKTEEAKRFEAKNDKIADESRIMALDEIMSNQKAELIKTEQAIRQSQSEISHLETLFAEPVAEQGVQFNK